MRERLLALVFTGLFLPVPAHAQDDKVKTVPFEGPEFFSHILHHEGLKPVRSLQEAEDDAAATMVIVFGNPRIFEADKLAEPRLKRFVENGGNLLIATDYHLYFDTLGIGISGSRVEQPMKQDAYRHDERCPLLSYGDSDVPGSAFGNDHPLFHHLGKKLATNCPSFVFHPSFTSKQRRPTSLQRLLYFSDSVKADIVQLGAATAAPGKLKLVGKDQPPTAPPAKPPSLLPYIVGPPKNAGPDGRVLLIAGHGMFMNGMMVQRDNDNFDFSLNAVRWLRESSTGKKRWKALFVVDSEIVGNFDMKLTGGPPIPVPTVEHLNRLLRGLEEERFFQKLLSDLFGVYLGRFIAILLALATFVLLIYGAKKLLEGRVHLETAVPSMVGLLPAPNSATPTRERSYARLRQGIYAAECRQLALDWLRHEFDVTPDRWLPGVQAEFAVTGSFWSRGRLRRQAALVLSLARANDTARVSRNEFFRLAQALHGLTEALRDGRLTLLVAGKNVRHSQVASG